MKVTKSKHGLEFISTKGMTRKQWLHNRQLGIGGSDISCLFNVNPYFSQIELLYQKWGLNFSANEVHNEATLSGTLDEDSVNFRAQYYNYETGEYLYGCSKALQGDKSRRLRRIANFPYMVRNKDYPFLLANVDGMQNFHAPTWMADRVIEAKTISRQSAEKWQGGIVPYHWFQVHFYWAVMHPMLREEMASIFYLQDGRKFYGFEIEINHEVIEQIIEKATDFWARVEKGREIIAENYNNTEKRDRYLVELEPEPDDTEAYSRFLSDLFLKKQNMVHAAGDEEVEAYVDQYKSISETAKRVEKEKQLINNQIKSWMHKNNCEKVTFDNREGQITFNKRLYINVK